MKLIFFLASSLFVSGLYHSTSAAESCASATCKNFRQDFQEVVNGYEEMYCYTELKEKQYNKKFAELVPLYKEAINDTFTIETFVWHMRKWAAEFKDGHVNLLPSKTGADFRIGKFDLRLALVEPATTKEEVVVIASPDSKIPIGSVIKKVDGKEVKSLIDFYANSRSGSTEIMRRRSAASVLLSTLYTDTGKLEYEIEYVGADGVAHQNPVKGASVLYSSEPSVANPPVVHSVLPGQILYIRWDIFDENTIGQFKKIFSTVDMTKINGILFDVRQNGGGSVSTLMQIISFLTPPNTKMSTGDVSPRITARTASYREEYLNWDLIPSTDFGVWTPELAGPDTSGIFLNKPLVLLIGNGCFSACDILASTISTNKLAKIVGEPTSGGSGRPISFSLLNTSHSFRYSVLRKKITGETLIEGNGTKPEIYIPRLTQDIRDQKDYQLDQALKLFKSVSKITNVKPLKLRPELVETNLYSEEALENWRVNRE